MVSSPPHITRPFSKVAIDLVSLLSVTKSKDLYTLTYINLVPNTGCHSPRTTTIDVIAKALLHVISRLSVPPEILSDRAATSSPR